MKNFEFALRVLELLKNYKLINLSKWSPDLKMDLRGG